MNNYLYVIGKYIEGYPYFLLAKSIGYQWIEKFDDATLFSSQETATSYLNMMSEEDCRIIEYYN